MRVILVFFPLSLLVTPRSHGLHGLEQSLANSQASKQVAVDWTSELDTTLYQLNMPQFSHLYEHASS